MLDIKLIRERPEIVRNDLKKRGDVEKLKMLDDLIEYDQHWRKLLTKVNELRHRRKVVTTEIARLKKRGEEVSKKLEEAKGELNRRVFRKGVMNKRCGKFAGMSVPEAQMILKKELVASKDAVMFYELTGKVVSRTLTECVVKIVDVTGHGYVAHGYTDGLKKFRVSFAPCLGHLFRRDFLRIDNLRVRDRHRISLGHYLTPRCQYQYERQCGHDAPQTQFTPFFLHPQSPLVWCFW